MKFQLFIASILTLVACQNTTTLPPAQTAVQSAPIAPVAQTTTISPLATNAITPNATSSSLTPSATPVFNATTPANFNVRISVLLLARSPSYGSASILQSLDSYGIPVDVVSEVNNTFPALNLEDASGNHEIDSTNDRWKI